MAEQAAHSQMRNDLYWSIFTGEDGTVRWIGYDDSNWWENVAPTEHARTRVGKNTGAKYVIDFTTGLVERSD